MNPAVNLFFDRLIINPKEYPPFGGGARGRAARAAAAGVSSKCRRGL